VFSIAERAARDSRTNDSSGFSSPRNALTSRGSPSFSRLSRFSSARSAIERERERRREREREREREGIPHSRVTNEIDEDALFGILYLLFSISQAIRSRPDLISDERMATKRSSGWRPRHENRGVN